MNLLSSKTNSFLTILTGLLLFCESAISAPLVCYAALNGSTHISSSDLIEKIQPVGIGILAESHDGDRFLVLSAILGRHPYLTSFVPGGAKKILWAGEYKWDSDKKKFSAFNETSGAYNPTGLADPYDQNRNPVELALSLEHLKALNHLIDTQTDYKRYNKLDKRLYPEYSKYEKFRHDFLSPFNIIFGFSELLLNQSLAQKPEDVQYWNHVMTAARSSIPNFDTWFEVYSKEFTHPRFYDIYKLVLEISKAESLPNEHILKQIIEQRDWLINYINNESLSYGLIVLPL